MLTCMGQPTYWKWIESNALTSGISLCDEIHSFACETQLELCGVLYGTSGHEGECATSICFTFTGNDSDKVTSAQ